MGLASKKFMADGGLYQEGGTVDEVSGNEVPMGSLKSEVRDDIDAKLSEGEFVFPADVVRFIGLDKLMKIRDEAKAGLSKMSDMGQMGNSEEASKEGDSYEEEGFTTTIDNILGEVDKERKYAEGGVVQSNAPPSIPSDMGTASSPPLLPPSSPPQQQMMEEDTGIDIMTVKNRDGDVLYIPFANGVPIISIPDGYKPEGQAEGFKLNEKGRAIPDILDPDKASLVGEFLGAIVGSKEMSSKTREYAKSFNAENIKRAIAANVA